MIENMYWKYGMSILMGFVKAVSARIVLYVSGAKKCWISTRLTGCKIVMSWVLFWHFSIFFGIKTEFDDSEHIHGNGIKQK